MSYVKPKDQFDAAESGEQMTDDRSQRAEGMAQSA
jgi:uncharacterized protein YjbJ (UPF0337 family)